MDAEQAVDPSLGQAFNNRWRMLEAMYEDMLNLFKKEDDESRTQAEETARHFLTIEDLPLAIRIPHHEKYGNAKDSKEVEEEEEVGKEEEVEEEQEQEEEKEATEETMGAQPGEEEVG
ncbi:hypothetical protein M8818_007447 [Zalaria obscura]|uniref:Uncharacterized protein n=1 Tax=Zalaria obscura TaxID=2024903 RepID=A0ACC3S3Q5_9PEZI